MFYFDPFHQLQKQLTIISKHHRMMKRELNETLSLREKIVKLKQWYLLGKYDELVIHDEYIYPPIQKDIKEILISQFGISLLDEYIKNSSEEKLSKKNKFPLPIIFAFIHHHLKANKYENLVRIIMQHVDRKTVEHYYILLYIIAKIYDKYKEYKKSIFYLESLLKESPFFSQGVYDLCFHYALSLERQAQACNILQRHINHSLPNQRFIHSLYIYICSKFKIRNAKEVIRNLHNKSMNLIAYFNLGLYLKQVEEFQKSYETFNQIVVKLTQAQKDGPIFTEKDEKLLIMTKINMLILLRNHSIFQQKNEEHYQSFYKSFLAEHKSALDSETIAKLSQSSQESKSSLPSSGSQKVFKHFRSSRRQKELSLFKQQRQDNTMYVEQKSSENKQNLKFNSTTPDFSTIRQYNNKKLKYLLEKEKQINHFFKNIVIKRGSPADKVQINYKIKGNFVKEQTNQSSIAKTKILNNHQFQFFQKQFENKRKDNQLKFDNVELQSMLTQIMTNFSNCVAQKKSQSKISVISKNYSQSPKQLLPKQSITPQKAIVAEKVPNTSQCNRSSVKNEKRALISQGSPRELKSDRSSLFRVKKASKQPKEFKQVKKQLKEFKQAKESKQLKQIKQQIKKNQIQEAKMLPKITKLQQKKQEQFQKATMQNKLMDQFLKKRKDQFNVVESKNAQIKSNKKIQINSIYDAEVSSLIQANIDYVLSILDPVIITESNQEDSILQQQKVQIKEEKSDSTQKEITVQKLKILKQNDAQQVKIQKVNTVQEIKVVPNGPVLPTSQKTLQKLQDEHFRQIDAILEDDNPMQSETMIFNKKCESEVELPQQSQIPQTEAQTFKIIVKQPASEPVTPSASQPMKQIVNQPAQATVDSNQNVIKAQDTPIQETPLQKLKPKEIIEEVKAPIFDIKPEPEPLRESLKVASPTYDPFASSFQLTGFGKASLSKFRDLKKKKVAEPQEEIPNQQIPIVVKKASSKKPEQPVKQMTPFQKQLKEGQDFEQAGQNEKAYELYTKLYKIYKNQSEKQVILIKIGNLFEKQQKFAEAEKTYLKCTKFNNVEAFLKLGALLLQNGRINSGVQNIQKANCIKRNDIQIENKLVYGYSLREQTMEKALNLAHMILKKQPESLETLIITANILQKQGKIKEAIEIMTAIDKFKSAEYIKHYLGILYLQDSNLTEAFNYFKAALSIKADYLPSLIEVATIISELNPKQSISILQKVLEIQPHNRKALARLGKIYESIQNDFQSAMVSYQTALQTQQNYESYMKIGDCLAKQESYIEALINYKEALNLKKTHEALAKIANMFELKEEFTKAIQNYEQALSLLTTEKDFSSLKRKEYLTYLGKLSMRVGNYDGGIKFFEEIEDYQDSIDILKLLSEAYFGKKQYGSALERYQKASELANGQNLEILENIAVCFDRMQEYLASKAIYQRILQKDSDNIRCMNNLANILLITGETNQSFYLFESMLQKVPKNLQKRLKVADIYAEVGDWSKVEFHLLHCLRIKQNDERVIQRLINLYKEKRDVKMANKYEKKLLIIRNNRKNQQKASNGH